MLQKINGLTVLKDENKMVFCNIVGCIRKVHAKGLCAKHYYQLPYLRERKLIRNRFYRQRPEVKKRVSDYRTSAEFKKRKNAYEKEYRKKEEFKRYNTYYQRVYHRRPRVKVADKKNTFEYRRRPEIMKKIKEYNHKISTKRYPHIRIFEENYKEIDYCQACGFKQVNGFRLDIHHLDNNEENNAVENLVRLCPTCHVYLIHRCRLSFEHIKEMRR